MLVVMAMFYCHFTCFNWLGLKALKLVALSGGRLGGGVGCGWARFCQTRVKILALTAGCFSFYRFLSFLIVSYMLPICLSLRGWVAVGLGPSDTLWISSFDCLLLCSLFVVQ